MRVSSPAKINPYLEVLCRRPDGFHDLDTLMLTLDLADELHLQVTREPGLRLKLGGPAASEDIPDDSGNLAWRAAAWVLDDAIARGLLDPKCGLDIFLHKKIPSRAGMGGGSSNAAAACWGSAQLLGNHWSRAQLDTCLGRLGSDCTFFLKAVSTGFARCQGRGEIVRPLNPIDLDWHVCLLTPALHISTPEVFAACERVLSERMEAPSVRENLFSCPESEARLGLFNRLEAAALEAVPALGVWRDLLDDHDAKHFLLSGSGSTFFGLYRSREEAGTCLARLRQAAQERGLPLRGSWIAQPRGAGVSELPDC